MADYKELLRRAISALPENNGAARRAVYEKARSALVGQLRAITPPLPARDITQHRLQLEDCIRQVEQEASEAVITLGREAAFAARPVTPPPTRPVAPAPRPVVEAPLPKPPPAVELPHPVETPRAVETPLPVDEPVVAAEPETPPAPVTSIEDIISQAAEASNAPVTLVRDEPKPVEAIAPEPVIADVVAKAEATKSGPSSAIPTPSNVLPIDSAIKAPSVEPRRDSVAPVTISPTVEPVRSPGHFEIASSNQAVARQAIVTPEVDEPVEPALSAVREVELESGANAAQVVIERAIETLDREARGEPTPLLAESGKAADATKSGSDADDDYENESTRRRGGGGLTIFLVVFAILLAGAGAGGYWAWREGYVDLDQMFGGAQAPVAETTQTPTTTGPTLDTVQQGAENTDAAAVPGNTAPTTATPPSGQLSGLEGEERLEPTPQATPNGTQSVLPSVENTDDKGEERLPDGSASQTAASDPSASVDPAVLSGSQSLLLEASVDGTSGAVPFSGTVEWAEGTDDLGQPTLRATASIPARNLGAVVTIRKNSDPSLPASHLMEVDFKVTDTFIGGTIASLPGILLKNEELVPGTALVGASARVVGNSFLFALSAAANDSTNNVNLLKNRRWMDLAVVYGTGRNAIITLEKDDAAQALFDKVFAAWGE